MNTTMQNKRRNRRHQRGFFSPVLGGLVHELMNSPLHEVDRKSTLPAANISKQDDAYLVQLAIPGVAKEQVTIKIDKDRLVVKSSTEESADIQYRLREFNYTNFERSFRLSEDVDTDNISAKFENGILSITVPTVKKPGPVTIEIG